MDAIKQFENFGSLVFNEPCMKENLPRPIYKKWKESIVNENSLDRHTADAIAHAMKTWAISKNVTHFTHWFQPLTGSTAEKHDSFIEPDENGQPIIRFSGKSLIKGESDASSFPSGGLRATFEARGYTYWDISSPAFIRDNILCIPTVFVSYNGESLDKKAPLLKSIEAVSNAAVKIVNIFGDKEVKQVFPMVGLEQEYFIIDRTLYKNRLDLMLCNRTLIGSLPPKSQELDDHYFGSIPTRVANFMKEVNESLWQLGIYAKAEHNEVAPCQFEIAPIFSSCNIAVDQNQLIMDILKKTAEKHELACLLHEKPFNGLNGSGKHNNWSLVTDDNQNLYEPGEKPGENVRFLLFMCAFIKAVDKYPELLRMGASNAGNDLRLGTSEAPPAIISIYLGDFIEEILSNLESSNSTSISRANQVSVSPITNLSYLPKDNTDRNRTSPMAFTGNKFEFRMLGSSLSSSSTNTFINTIVAEVLDEIADELSDLKYKHDIRKESLDICKRIIKQHKRILFSKDGYSNDWLIEAKSRGLVNIETYVESINSLIDDKAINLFTKYNIYSKIELYARHEILAQQYNKTIGIEVKTLIYMIKKNIVPNIMQELNDYLNIASKTNIEFITNKVNQLSCILTDTTNLLDILDIEYNKIINSSLQSIDKGLKIKNEINPIINQIRLIVDNFEDNCNSKNYTLPTYVDMLNRTI